MENFLDESVIWDESALWMKAFWIKVYSSGERRRREDGGGGRGGRGGDGGAELDFGQFDGGHPYLFDFGQFEFGQFQLQPNLMFELF